MNSLLEQAQRFTASGVSVLPIKSDGSKSPAVSSWKPYQSKIATPEELQGWFQNGHGIGIIGGEVSGNLEILDFDHPDAFEDWCALVKKLGGDALLKRLVMVQTPSAGFHLYYRCQDGVEGNKKLAQSKDSEGKLKVLIETRGEGGYVVAPGSPDGCHPLRKLYKLLQGDLAEIPTITSEERELLLNAARALNECVEPKCVISGGSDASGDRPGDDFNAKASWEEILEPRGWEKVGERDEVTHWRRPGKGIGVSATTNHGGTDLFYNFSSNGHPFEAETGYTKFAAYTFLEHDGDFSAAAGDLAGNGYGKETFFAFFASFAPQVPENWPQPLAEEAFYGLVGDVIRTIEPHTEADSAALLIQFLVAAGNVVGKNPHFMAEADRHGTNLNSVVVGETAKGRKGTSWGHIKRLFNGVDKKWVKDRIQSGLSSGEGLIWAVRDPIEKLQPIKVKQRVEDYQMVTEDPGVSDKRLLVVEGEFSSILKVAKREGNTLSPVIRNAWDSGNLNTLTKNSPAKATDAHISIIGHITRQELLRYMEDTEAANGFGNRFLWVCSSRSKILPEGGCIQEKDLIPLIAGLIEALKFAHETGEFKFDEEARRLWYAVYPELSEGKPGLLGSMIARSEAQVRRVACVYALLDCSSVIRREHLKAALAVWRYCEDSCRYIFGDAMGDPVADTLLEALRNSPDGMTRTSISNLFKGHKRKAQIERTLVFLQKKGLIGRREQDTGGRTAEIWFAVETAKEAKKAKEVRSSSEGVRTGGDQ